MSVSAESLPTYPASASSDAGESASRRSRSFWARHRRAISATIGAVVAAGFVYYVLPRLARLGPTLRLLRRGDVWWLALGVVLEALSFVGMIVLFRGAFSTARNRIDWRASYQITVAGRMTLVPAISATCVIVIVLSMLFVDEPAERFLKRRAERASERMSARWRRAAALPRCRGRFMPGCWRRSAWSDVGIGQC